jgi:hypothetical protein
MGHRHFNRFLGGVGACTPDAVNGTGKHWLDNASNEVS